MQVALLSECDPTRCVSMGRRLVIGTLSRSGIRLASGYEIPTQKDCDKCHHGGADKLLGVEAVALAVPSAEGATLESLVANDRLSYPPRNTHVLFPNDESGRAADALAYMHANCGMACHSTRGIGQETELVLRIRASELWPDGQDGDTPPLDASATDIYAATFERDPTTASVAQQFPGAKRITPGAHEQSLVWLLAHVRDRYQMLRGAWRFPLIKKPDREIGRVGAATSISTTTGQSPRRVARAD